MNPHAKTGRISIKHKLIPIVVIKICNNSYKKRKDLILVQLKFV